jgi:NitT/TauT family transport system ATP-binding protein
MSENRLRIGFIPLADAAALVIAVDKGFAEAEGLAIDLQREVSWSNVRDKLNIGLFDAAHLLAPMAIASSLGLHHVRVPLIAPFMLGLNGNAVTVSPRLYDALSAAANGDLGDPAISARALARVIEKQRANGAEPLTFGMTFPFSTHNYQLRLWMAAGGIDPDEDVRLVVLPPPYMAESLANQLVDGFCVGAPWNSVAVELGIGRILHFGSDIVACAPEKVLALRASWLADRPDMLSPLLRALGRAAEFINNPDHIDEAAALVAAPHRVDVDPAIIRRTIEGRLRVAPARNDERANSQYILIGRGHAARPDPTHAAWLYAQMVRWRQAPLTADLLAAATACFRPDLYDQALGSGSASVTGASDRPPDSVGAFCGPLFDSTDLAGYVAALNGPFAGR